MERHVLDTELEVELELEHPNNSTLYIFCYQSLLLFDIGKEEPINIDVVSQPVRNTDMKCSGSKYLHLNEDSITVSVGVMPFLSSRYYYKILLPMDKFACLKIDLCLVIYSPGFVVTRFRKSLMTSRKKKKE
uniref:Uncharacterized protein n=1 Tax=Glossina austeni TaxID=7395 RepID=A0A1A9VCX8_GLOAU